MYRLDLLAFIIKRFLCWVMSDEVLAQRKRPMNPLQEARPTLHLFWRLDRIKEELGVGKKEVGHLILLSFAVAK